MRIDATNPKYPELHKFLFLCDCVDSHYLEVEWDEDVDDDWPGYLNITETVYAIGLWERVKAATKVLLGQRHYFGGVVLDEDTANKLIETIGEQRNAVREAKGKVEKDGKVQQAS